MIRRTFRVKLFCLGILLFLLSTMAAQDTGNGVAIINGGRNAIYTKVPSHVSTPSVPSDPQLVKIYSNLGTGKNVYNGIADMEFLEKMRASPGQNR